MLSLEINNLKVKANFKQILNGINLKIRPGEVHAIMGPNGSGKSTLASALMGHPQYQIQGGTIKSFGKNILKLSPEQRAKLGLFLSFQYPVEVPGLSLENFLRTAYNNLHPRKLSVIEFHKLFEEKMKFLKIKREVGSRSLNEGFSGGEKKKAEILQLSILAPKIAILDETDSGLDIDALKTVARGIDLVKKEDKKMSILVITHYFRILRYLSPDYVHIMIDGKIVKSGRRELAAQVERKGYDWLR